MHPNVDPVVLAGLLAQWRDGTRREPSESIDCEVYTPGQHAFLTLSHMTLTEAVKMAFVARIAKPGDNCSPAMTLRHAGEVLAVLGCEPGEVIVSVRHGANGPTVVKGPAEGQRADGRERTLVSPPRR